MIGLFFEVTPRDGHADRYFELAAFLKPELERSGGCLFLDRYVSLRRSEVFLSHQFWADEESLIRWRENKQHRAIQRAGREQHFADYRLRIGRALDAPQAAYGRTLCVSYLDGEPAGEINGEPFKSVYREGKYLVLIEGEPLHPFGSDYKAFEIMRDYTMYERREAPQDYPAVARP
jgi:heme-degrading monooxygenase HmoA